ncbi:LysR family transcriptional regulator [Pusillimonas sp. NJUB218]|uniref:LysR family transcriptional regulator n=1 Tax=Pusillimonas sp. NJUB218 TaxID=2023230 RepID=UPI000F4B2001|nr:LysR family transcriptional regulator [Pusillimonas sp. NJUB218]ROT44578.1 hypothetical protein CHR62_11110 [Pusillimonas sp. NJUB218]
MSQEIDFRRLMGRLRLRHLALLDWLGKDPNVGRAAKKLHMAQPTASKLLREIEDIFETPLFTRNRRGLTPTAAGQVLTRRAGILLAEMQATHTELLYALGGGTGHMRLGVFPVVVPEFLPKLYSALQSQWPGLTIELREAVELQLLDQLSKGEIDGIIGRIVMENLTPDLRHEAVYTEPTVIVCGTHHPLRNASAEARVQILEQTAWMLPARQGAVYNLVASRLAQFGIKAPRVDIETTSVFATIEMLNHTNLLSILPEKIALDYQANQKVAVAPIDDLGANYPIGVIYRADAADNPLVAMLLKTTRTLSSWPAKH